MSNPLTVTIEDNLGNVIGFVLETTIKDGGGKNRGDVTEIHVLAPEKTFPRSVIANVDPDQLGIPKVNLPVHLGTAPKAELDTPENLKLFIPPPAPGQADLGKSILAALEQVTEAIKPKKPAPQPK